MKIQKVQLDKANLNKKPSVSIDELYLKQAYNIRIDYENVHLLVNNREKDINNLKKSIKSLKEELQRAQKDIKNGDKTIMNNVYKILGKLEDESQKLSKVINPIENKMDELRRDEVILHETLKEKYPHVDDRSLKDAIINYIVERKRDQ